MAETPDFQQIARETIERAYPVAVITAPESPFKTRQEHVNHIAEQLRLVWNARGAADVIAIDETGYLMTAIQALDR